MHTYTYTHTHVHTQTHTDTHKHPHTRMYILYIYVFPCVVPLLLSVSPSIHFLCRWPFIDPHFILNYPSTRRPPLSSSLIKFLHRAIYVTLNPNPSMTSSTESPSSLWGRGKRGSTGCHPQSVSLTFIAKSYNAPWNPLSTLPHCIPAAKQVMKIEQADTDRYREKLRYRSS